MKINTHQSLKSLNSFAVDVVCPQLYIIDTIEDLYSLPDLSNTNFYILGEGSNTLFADETSPIIIHSSLEGITVEETENDYVIRVKSGENWSQLVDYCTAHQYFGLENLALIPGSVGAAPIQNIGAYGVELAHYCDSVCWFDFASKQIVNFSNEECQFSYRDSLFKQELNNKGFIIAITLKLTKHWQPHLHYEGLHHLADNVSAREVMEAVIKIRRSKLPDPAALPNAGSFFKNPIVSTVQFDQLLEIHGDIPHFVVDDNYLKIPAAWLIQQAGVSTVCLNGVRVYQHHALVIVNPNHASGKDIAAFAKIVQCKVHDVFKIVLEPEVRIVTKCGEQKEKSVYDVV